MTQTRKLAAIMFTDIVGYTAISAKDEEKAFQLLNTQRSLLKPIVEKYDGLWRKEMGDGLLLTFTTVTNAVRCAIEIQNTTKEIKDFDLRIGIHQGEVTEEDGDVFGDDVNIASRIEPFAAPGGIAISQKVQQDISSLPEFTAKYVGQPNLKGVRQDITVHCITSHGLPETKYSDVSAKLERTHKHWIRPLLISITGLILAGIVTGGWYVYPFLSLPEPVEHHFDKAIAVLYLDNMGASEDQYFADGLTEELITRLARISNLKVASRTDVGIYRAQPASIQQIADDLNVDYIVEGSVRKAKGQFRVTAQLINAVDGFYLWAETYNSELENIFALQDSVAKSIASNLEIVISAQDQPKILIERTSNLEAYDLVLESQSLLLGLSQSGSHEDFQHVTSMLQLALSLDPVYADAHALLAASYFVSALYVLAPDPQEYSMYLEQASLEAEEALALDPTNALALSVGPGLTSLKFFKNLSDDEMSPIIARKMMLQMRKLVELYPDSPTTYFAMALYYDIRSRIRLVESDDMKHSVDNMRKALASAERDLMAGQRDFISNWIAREACLPLGYYAYEKGDYIAALKYWTRGRELAVEVRNRHYTLGLSIDIGRTHNSMGNYPEALMYMGEALDTARELGIKWSEGIALHLVGEINLRVGDSPVSAAYFDSADAIWGELGKEEQKIWTRSWWALAELKSDNMMDARAKAENVETMLNSTEPSDEDIVIVNWNLSQVYIALKDSTKQSQYLEVAYREVLNEADKHRDEKEREYFLTNISVNQEVIAAWNKLGN